MNKSIENMIDNMRFSDKELQDLNGLSERICRQAKREDYIIKCENIKESLSGKLEYKNWIILWDLTQNDYYHIANDLRKNKITMKNIKDVIKQANKIEKIFNEKEIMERIS